MDIKSILKQLPLVNMYYYFVKTILHLLVCHFSQSQSREIASLRTRNVELEGDVERLRRQLTSEKFER